MLTLAILGGDRLPVTAWTAGLDRWAFDVRQRALERELPDNLLIVGTGGSAGAERASEWGVPWEMLQEFIQRARDAGASVIVLDVMLQKSGDPAADSAFASVLAARKDIVLAADVKWVQPSGNGATAFAVQEALLPPPLFTESATAVGVRSATLDPDSVVRRAQPQSTFWAYPTGRSQWKPSGCTWTCLLIKSDSRVGSSSLASTESRWGASLTLTIDAPVRPSPCRT